MMNPTPTRSNADRADQTRARILEAATREFSANGLAGARTERIAESAGVNKALLYYYFRGKDALYAAALEAVASRIAASSMGVLGRECSAGERLLRSALNHFDRIYSQPVFQTLMQQEMIRLRKGEANALSPLVEKLFRPMGDRMMAAAEEGVRRGELIPVEASQLMYATLGPNVFYFLSAPLMRLISEMEVFHPSALEFRRKATVEYLGQSIFMDREHGGRIAARVLADTPMPQYVEPPAHQFQNVGTENHKIEPAVSPAVEVRHK
ncbi:MAG: TetR/AcrR family transcriptional regulator [Terracidiphilus sp.]|jgi:TetR/AcrR family transcriptional regulator